VSGEIKKRGKSGLTCSKHYRKNKETSTKSKNHLSRIDECQQFISPKGTIERPTKAGKKRGKEKEENKDLDKRGRSGLRGNTAPPNKIGSRKRRGEEQKRNGERIAC